MSRPVWEVAGAIRLFGDGFRERFPLSAPQKKALSDLANCRTAALGGHVDACEACGAVQFSYNSCRNRHCPKCQGLEREAWVLAREGELLPVPYYHVVFTLPPELNGLCLHNPRFCYDTLFESAWETLHTFAADSKWLGAQTGATVVLHTWGQQLMLHPHVHCIVPGGGLDKGGHWARPRRSGKTGERFLFPVKVMSRVFRAVFMKKLRPVLEAGTLALPGDEACFAGAEPYRAWRNGLYEKPWVVYAKRPFGGPKEVIEYLGRYTHKSAISNHRLLEVGEETGVRFSYKDYRTGGERKEMRLDGVEFLRRWSLHVLPPGFRRMRHYGILSNALKTRALNACRKALSGNRVPCWPAPVKLTPQEVRRAALERLWRGRDPQACPCCGGGRLVRIGIIPPQPRAPPDGMPFWIAAEV